MLSGDCCPSTPGKGRLTYYYFMDGVVKEHSVAKRGVNGALFKLFRGKDYTLHVAGAQELSPTMRTVVFHAPELVEATQPHNGDFIRCWFDDPERNRQVTRAYTLCDIDYEAGQFAMHFLLHEPAGPAAVWARNAAAGDTLGMTSFSSHHFTVPSPRPAGYVFVVDAASLPYLSQVVPTIPEDVPVQVWVQKYHDSDTTIPLLPEHGNVTITWISGGTQEVSAKAQAFDWSGWAVDVVTEMGVLKALRPILKNAGIPKTHQHTQGYWIHGRPFN